MNQASIKPISAVKPSDGNALSKSQSSAQTENASQARLASARLEKAQAETKKETDQIGSLANVSIHFRVDDKTDNVTVFLVDRKTKKILRSIPANELQKLQIADLLKLTA
jgi:uncharacterized FlaG/YvyC family protein